MKKKLTAKIQQLNPTLPQYSGSFSKCISIEPDTNDVVLKKGSVYAVFEIQGDASFDTELISKVTNDVIHNSYYQSENISPIQSMEKTILEARDKIIQLSSDVLRTDRQPVGFNIVASVLWGNVLYVVQYGEMKCFIMSQGTIKPLPTISEGNFSAASQVVDNDDVIIFCTESFQKELPPEKLLSSSVSDQTLKPNQACLLMKLIIDTNFSEDEIIDFGLEKAISKAKSKAISDKGFGFVNSALIKFKGIFSKILKSKMFSRVPVIPKFHLPKIQKSTSSIGFSKFVFKPWMALPFVIVLIVLVIIPLIRNKKSKDNQIAKEQSQSTASVETSQKEQKEDEEAKKVIEENKKIMDNIYKVQRISPEVFYDIKITDAQAKPTELAAFADKLVAADKTTGKLFVSEIKTPKFTAQSNTYPGIRSVVNSDGKVNFLDNSGYKVYNLVSSSISEGQTLTAEIAFPYSGYIYTVSNGVIKKYKDVNTEPMVWGEQEDFKNAKSIAITFNIYIINSKNELLSFSVGKKNDFKVTGLENGFADAVKVVADVDLKNIYVADKGNKSVVVLDTKGSLVKQFKTQKEETWNDIRSITVSPDEKTLYVLSESKVFLVKLAD
jgi:hypothetical protein